MGFQYIIDFTGVTLWSYSIVSYSDEWMTRLKTIRCYDTLVCVSKWDTVKRFINFLTRKNESAVSESGFEPKICNFSTIKYFLLYFQTMLHFNLHCTPCQFTNFSQKDMLFKTNFCSENMLRTTAAMSHRINLFGLTDGHQPAIFHLANELHDRPINGICQRPLIFGQVQS